MKRIKTLLKEFKKNSPMNEEIQILYDYIVKNKPQKKIVELGCGDTTFALSLAIKVANLYPLQSIDLDMGRINMYGKSLASIGLQNYCQFYHGDSVNILASVFNPETISFIFIDTSHTFPQTLAEIVLSVSVLEKNGRIFLHDTKIGEVRMAIYKFLELAPDWEFYEYNTKAGLGVLKRK